MLASREEFLATTRHKKSKVGTVPCVAPIGAQEFLAGAQTHFLRIFVANRVGRLSEHDFSSQRARSSKEVTEADAFLCDLDPSLCALCVSTPLLWLGLRPSRYSVGQ
jgi:hypothetical protein